MIWISLSANGKTLIVYGERANPVEINAANDLLADIKKVYPKEEVSVQRYTSTLDLKSPEHVVIVGTQHSNLLVSKFWRENPSEITHEPLQPETFVLQSSSGQANEILYIIGADERGTYYGVYEFSRRVLAVDPFEFWTGSKPVVRQTFNLPELSFRQTPPTFPLRGYFDNDDDFLANWKGRKLIVELDIWKEMINSLARLGYNYIDIHDLLGRPEFYEWDYYKKMTEYHTDLKLVDEVIDYAHSKGMLVQIPMYLGWEFHHMDLEKVCLSEHMDHWMENYRYYLEETPLGKGDLFLQRPRHPYYDYGYNCPEELKAGIKPGPLMTEMFNKLQELILTHNPKAVLFCDLWREGRPMWASGEFAPNKNIQMLWADYGVADFQEWPENKLGYNFGIYIHAGVWQNQVVQDPYPDLIKKATLEAVSRKMNHNYLVNGQSFKNFILNLEACARASWNPESFNPDAFYKEWTTRYFGAPASAEVVQSMQMLHQANGPMGGFQMIMAKTVSLLDNIEKGKLDKLQTEKIEEALKLAERSYNTALLAGKKVEKPKQNVFNDQVLFPAKIFKLNLELFKAVAGYNNMLAAGGGATNLGEQVKQQSLEVKAQLRTIRQTLNQGSGWKKWDGWTNCENFRVFTPPPTPDQLTRIKIKYNIH